MSLVRALDAAFVDYLNYGGYPEALFFQGIRKTPRRYINSDIIDKVNGVDIEFTPTSLHCYTVGRNTLDRSR